MNLRDLYQQQAQNQFHSGSYWPHSASSVVGSPLLMRAHAFQPAQPKKGGSMFSQVATDVKGFIVEHRSVIYFLAVALLLDHFLFKGVFRHRLQALAEKLVSKVEERIT